MKIYTIEKLKVAQGVRYRLCEKAEEGVSPFYAKTALDACCHMQFPCTLIALETQERDAVAEFCAVSYKAGDFLAAYVDCEGDRDDPRRMTEHFQRAAIIEELRNLNKNLGGIWTAIGDLQNSMRS